MKIWTWKIKSSLNKAVDLLSFKSDDYVQVIREQKMWHGDGRNSEIWASK